MGRVIKNILKSTVLLAVIFGIAYFWLRPTSRELETGWNPPQILSWEQALAISDTSTAALDEERAKSSAWLSSSFVLTLEKGIRDVSLPPFSIATWVMNRVVNERLPQPNNFILHGLMSMAVVFLIGIVAILCGWLVLLPHANRYCRRNYWDSAFIASVISSACFGLGLLGQISLQIFLLPFILFAVGLLAAVFCVKNLIRDILSSHVWSLFTVAAIGVGFFAGFFIAVALFFALTMIWFSIIVALFYWGAARCIPILAYSTGRKHILARAMTGEKIAEVTKYTDGSWRDEHGHSWECTEDGTYVRER